MKEHEIIVRNDIDEERLEIIAKSTLEVLRIERPAAVIIIGPTKINRIVIH